MNWIGIQLRLELLERAFGRSDLLVLMLERGECLVLVHRHDSRRSARIGSRTPATCELARTQEYPETAIDRGTSR